MRIRTVILAAVLAIGAARPLLAADSAALARIEEARGLLAANKPEQAIAAFQAALLSDPANGVAHNALGSLFNGSGRYSQALPHALAAVAAEPGNMRYRYNRAVVLAEHGRFAEAIADFDLAIAADPALVYAWLERGAARLSLGDAKGADADWAQAAKVDPALIWVQWYRGTGEFTAGRFAEAAALFDRVAQSQPDFVPAQLWRAVAHGRAGAPVAVASAAGGEWPAPVIDFYRGAIPAERLVALASDDLTTGDSRRLAEALYFIGQQELIRGRTESASEYFRRALAVPAPRHVWRLSAERELARLKAGA